MSDQPLTARTHSLRNYSAEEFRDEWMAAEPGSTERTDIRITLRGVESGRLHAMLKAAHEMFATLDLDEKQAFADANPNLVEWISVYGLVEHLNPFDDYRE